MADEVDAPNPTIKSTTKAGAGVTGHNVRYVLAFGLAGAIIAFLIIGLYFYGVQFYPTWAVSRSLAVMRSAVLAGA